MCGIIGISNNPEASKLAYLGLYALQHRGEEASGIATFDGKDVHIIKDRGLVVDVFNGEALESLKGNTAIATWSLSRSRADHAAPAAMGRWDPTIAYDPSIPTAALVRCIDPPLALHSPVALLMSSARHSSGEAPRAIA